MKNNDTLNKPVILFGTGRSGSSVFMNGLFRHRELAFFTNILERRPEWMWTNRFRYFTDNSCYRLFPDHVGKPFNKFFLKPVEGYSIWAHIVGSEINFGKSFLDNERPSESLKRNARNYVEELVKVQNRSRFALKITGPGRLFFLSKLFPNACFIWLKRDFIPTLHSFLKVNFWQERSTGELWWKSEKIEEILNEYKQIKTDPVLFTTFQLQAIISDIEKTISEYNLDVLEISYGEFVKDPVLIFKKTLEFCSLRLDKDCFKFLQNNEIENRNKSDIEYFNEAKLREIQSLRNSFKANYNNKESSFL